MYTLKRNDPWCAKIKWSKLLNGQFCRLLDLCVKHVSFPRLNKFLQYLTEAGFRVSRTHFDPTGVRTDATLEQFKSVLTKYSVPTYSSGPPSSLSTEDMTAKKD